MLTDRVDMPEQGVISYLCEKMYIFFRSPADLDSLCIILIVQGLQPKARAILGS